MRDFLHDDDAFIWEAAHNSGGDPEMCGQLHAGLFALGGARSAIAFAEFAQHVGGAVGLYRVDECAGTAAGHGLVAGPVGECCLDGFLNVWGNFHDFTVRGWR